MTQQVEAPLTRRALRASVPTMGDADAAVHERAHGSQTAPRTRREIRMAERALAPGSGPGVVRPRDGSDAPVVERTEPAPSASAPAAGPAPLTRREIRLAEQERARQEQEREAEQSRLARAAACRPPFVASIVVPARTLGVRDLPARAAGLLSGLARGGVRPVAVVAVSAGLLIAGVSQVQAEQSLLRTAMAQAEAALTEQARVDRASEAATERLDGQATAYAAARRTQAVAAAAEAVQTAQGVKEVAAPVLDEATLASLDQAAAQLEAMLAATAVPVPVDQPAATDGQGATPEELSAGSDVSTASRDVTAEDETPAPAGEPAASAPVRSQSASRGTDRTPVPDEQAAEIATLDLQVTEQILAAAQQVTQLSAEVRATADARIAEVQAAAAAAEAARVAAEAAAAELERKVDVARAAENGEIPEDVLCGVGFTRGVQLRCDAAAALEKLNEAYRADFGRDLDVVSSYRSFGAQVTTKRARGYLAAQPGTSNHGLGLAVDFGDFGSVGDFSSPRYRWMKANAERFGWHHPRIMEPGGGGPQEPWHWEFGTAD